MYSECCDPNKTVYHLWAYSSWYKDLSRIHFSSSFDHCTEHYHFLYHPCKSHDNDHQLADLVMKREHKVVRLGWEFDCLHFAQHISIRPHGIGCKQSQQTWCKKIYHMNKATWLNPLYLNLQYWSMFFLFREGCGIITMMHAWPTQNLSVDMWTASFPWHL